ncbi:hypothetical protein [Lysobacter terrae]
MNTTKLRGKLRVRVLISIAFLILLPACRPSSHSPDPTAVTPPAPLIEGVIVTAISRVEVDTTASAQEDAATSCLKWTLTGKQAEELISLSREIDERTYHHDYDTAPCKIGGLVRRQGRTWQFTINGAAKVMLKRGNEVKYLGCEAQGCESLVMSMPDRSPTP